MHNPARLTSLITITKRERDGGRTENSRICLCACIVKHAKLMEFDAKRNTSACKKTTNEMEGTERERARER